MRSLFPAKLLPQGSESSSLTHDIARRYDLFQASLELVKKKHKFLNYGYTISGKETYEERQQQLCIEVFQAAEIGTKDFIISEGQVRYAQELAIQENLAPKLSFRLGEAECLPDIEALSVDRILAIE